MKIAWEYRGGRLGDHAVTMCEQKDGQLIVKRVPFQGAELIEARGGYQCESMKSGTYPLPKELPQTGGDVWLIVILVLGQLLARYYISRYSRLRVNNIIK